MYRPSKVSVLAPLTILSTAATAIPTAAVQLGGRPADEWAITLESGRRMEGLEIEAVVAAIELESGDVVADIGAGTGVFSVPMARAVGPSGLVLAQEVDAGFLPIILEKARSAGVSNVRAGLGEFEDPKLPRTDVDVAFFHDVLHHIEGRADYIAVVADYIAPGGRIVVVDYDMNVPGVPHASQPEMLINPQQVAGWMADAGFEVTREWDLFDDKFVVEYTKVD